MNNEKLKQVLDSFFTNETQKVLVIKGNWGIGKTYFWKDYIQNKINHHQLPDMISGYSYVSLFGIANLSDLQDKIMVNTNVFDESDPNAIDTNGALKEAGFSTNGILKILSKIPVIKDQFFDVTPYLHNLIQNQVICFDDLERCHDDFNIEILMGYVDELVQEKDCKVVIIFNEEQLESTKKEKFDKYREKIVDIEATYNPALECNFNVVFAESNIDEDWQKKVRERCILLSIDNIRVLKKIRYGLEEYWRHMQGNEFPDNVRDPFIQNFVSFYSLYLEEKEDRYKEIKNKIFSGTLKISNVENMGYVSAWRDKKKDTSLDLELLSKYLLESSSIFDDDIVFYINNGYISSGFITKSERWHEMLQYEAKVLECKNKISKVWDLYHSTLQDNLDVIIKILDDLIKDDDIFDYLDVQNFFQFVKNFYFFQNLKDREYEIREIYPYIDQYMDKNESLFLRSNINNILTSIELTSFGAQGNYESVIDAYAKEKLHKLRFTQYQNIETWDLLKKIYDTGFLSPEEKLLLENITKGQYIELFEKHECPELTMIVRQAYRELSPDKRGEFDAALDEISKQSTLNAHRITALKKIH